MRKIENGICWVNYDTDTKEDAEKWYKEITGVFPEKDEIIFFRGMWNFRIHK